MATADGDDDLTCALCLNTYKSPKFLPCYHTYCEGCIVDLDENRGNNPLQCPKCRQNVELPPGGVSELQTNFYITPLLNPECCQLHRTEKLRFYCTQCSIAICLNCRLTDHYKHEAHDLGKATDEARKELKNCQERLGKSESTLKTQLDQVLENISFSGEIHGALKRLIRERVEQITLMARECGDGLVNEVERSFHDLQVPLREDEHAVRERLSTVRDLQQEVTQGLEGASTRTLLTLTSDMRTGRASQQKLDQLTADLPRHNVRPVLRFDDRCLQPDVIRKFLGHVAHFESIPIQQSVTIREVFRCCQETQLYVHAMCIDSSYRFLRVSYGTSGTGGAGCVVSYTQSGGPLNKSACTTKGRVCLTGLNTGFVRVEGKEFTARDLIIDTYFADSNNHIPRRYDVYNKGNARFLLRVHTSGGCDFRTVTIEGLTDTTDSKVCDVSAKDPIAMDVSKDGQLLAVLEEGRDQVLLYRHGDTEPYALYRVSGDAFRPLDVCFYFIGGEERLVVADWLNDVLHVVDVREGCTLIGHVGGECPALVKPTALCCDLQGGLWIGCQGGHILTLTQPSTTQSDDDRDLED